MSSLPPLPQPPTVESTPLPELAKPRVVIVLRPGDTHVLAEVRTADGDLVCATQGEDRQDAAKQAREAYEATTGVPLKYDGPVTWDVEVSAADLPACGAIAGRNQLAALEREAQAIVDAARVAAHPLSIDAERMKRLVIDALLTPGGGCEYAIVGNKLGEIKNNDWAYTWKVTGVDGKELGGYASGPEAIALIAAQPQFAIAVRDRLAERAAQQATDAAAMRTAMRDAPAPTSTLQVFLYCSLWLAVGFGLGLLAATLHYGAELGG